MSNLFSFWQELVAHQTTMTKEWSIFFEGSVDRSQQLYHQCWNFNQSLSNIIKKSASHPADNSILTDWQDYYQDYAERSLIFFDILRQRGNEYIAHNQAGNPPVLIFDYQMIADGRTFKHPVNYALVEILPPKGMTIDPDKRPFLIIDPRAGHGSGIGGFKDDSQVGIALRAGHPVYFVIFFPEPEPRQTLRSVAQAERQFAELVHERHPHGSKPCIIGNCQGGWAVMALVAANPDLASVLVINGAPLSYWAGEDANNPLRCIGALLGGSWAVQCASDLGGGKFDGANLVQNFEGLNPAHTYWGKYYHLFSHVDSEEQRFLDFERWWGGFYLLNAEEVRSISDSLFIGNQLSHGRIPIDRDTLLDLRKIDCPILIFCSEGDNITPPQQALNWIVDMYDDVKEIKAAGQVIVYLIHQTIGHLGLFVSGNVATKEHTEIFGVLSYIEMLPPGLYEMVIDAHQPSESEVLQKHSKYTVRLEERTIQDITDPHQHQKGNEIFHTVSIISQFSLTAYDMFFSKLIQGMATPHSAEGLRQLHPLRMSRYLMSDYNPWLKAIAPLAEKVRQERKIVDKNNVFLELQEKFSGVVNQSLNNYRDRRNLLLELRFHQIYGFFSILFSDLVKREKQDIKKQYKEKDVNFLANIELAMIKGDLVDALIRIMLLLITEQGYAQGSRIANTQKLLRQSLIMSQLSAAEIRKKIHMQTLIITYEPKRAWTTLPQLLPTPQQRELALQILYSLLPAKKDMTKIMESTLKHVEKLLSV